MNNVLKEAKRLHGLGFAIIWLHPKSKRPLASKWTTGERESWESLEKSFKPGMNVGVRTGEASKVGQGYLCCIDMDIKDETFKDTLYAKLTELIGELVLPEVTSGNGKHFYCITPEPFRMLTVIKDKERGELCVYSSGRQMVLPPSIHPSGRAYEWAVPITGVSSLPVINFGSPVEAKTNPAKKVKTGETDFDFTPCVVDLAWLPISDSLKDGIINGVGVEDRSSYLLPASAALLSIGLSRDEILSVLTDRETFIGKAALERKSGNRTAAAKWVYEYTLKGVEVERDPKRVFKKESGASKELTWEEMEAEQEEFNKDVDWKDGLALGGDKGQGPPKGTLQNVVLILQNHIASNLFERNTFAYRDTYGADAPWGAKKGDLIQDIDTVCIKMWLSRTWQFEPKNNIIDEAILHVAKENSYDPVLKSLKALPAWDGVPRLDTWLVRYFDARGSAAYNGEVFTKWLVAMVMRAHEPGSKFDWMPIFEGVQGIGKSSFGKILAGGEKYFLDWLPNLHDKDAALGLQGMWSVEMGELASLRKNELEVVKGFITRTIDKVRPPFGRRVIESARRCVFFGTTNRDQYLQDDTGNRRFKPIIVGKLNFKQLKKDRDQLFAEAKHLWDTKKETERTLGMFSDKAFKYEKTVHQEKLVRDDSSIMFDMILDFKKDPEKCEHFRFEKFKLYQLFQGNYGAGVPPLSKFQMNRRNEMMAAKALKLIGAIKMEKEDGNYWKLENSTETPKNPPGVKGGVQGVLSEEKW